MSCRSVAPALLALTVAACSAGENPSAGGDAAAASAREQVTQRLNEYMQLPLTGNAAAILEYWTPDAKIYEPEMVMSGADLAGFAKTFFETSRVAELKITPTETVVHDDGKAVYMFGNNTERVEAKTRSSIRSIRSSVYRS